MVFLALDAIYPRALAHGACSVWSREQERYVLRGADRWADEWAKANGIVPVPFEVKPREWTTIGRRAGPLRNEKMLTEFKPDLVVWFPGGSGTEGCKGIAVRLGIPLVDGLAEAARRKDEEGYHDFLSLVEP